MFPHSPRPAFRERAVAPALWALLLFAGCLALYTRQNTFPFFYHPDEPGKVEQVLSGAWNFHHPMLLLASARLAVSALHVEANAQSVVVAGRWVSAVFAAGAVAALALLAHRRGGMAAGVCAGVLLALHHQLFELAHYFKEDTALLLGIAFSFLAMQLVSERATLLRVIFLGGSCGLALAGKYLGAVVFALALPVLLTAEDARRAKNLALFFAALAAVFALVNVPLLAHLATFRESFGREMDFVIAGQKEMTRRVPHTEYLSAFRNNTTPALWFFLAWHLAAFWRTRRERSLAEWLTLIFPFAFTLLLSFSPKANDRYFLPATALFTYLAALGVLDCATWLGRFTPRPVALGACAALAALAQLVSLPAPLAWKDLHDYYAAFQRDDRADLRAWIEHRLPPGAVLAQDPSVRLPDGGTRSEKRGQPPLEQTVLTNKAFEAAPDLIALRSLGVTHVVVSENDYGRYFRASYQPKAGFSDEITSRRQFYEELFRDGELQWERLRSAVIYLHPGIRVYRLR